METCENCKRVEDMYIKDIAELNAEIARLKRDNDKLSEQLGVSESEAAEARRLIRHI